MKRSSSFQRRKLLTMTTLLPMALLVGCGGGEDNYETVDLFAAYETISQGMSYTHVRSIVGRDPESATADGASVLYRWETGQHTYLFSTLVVAIHNQNGAVMKSFTGPEGNKTEAFDPEE